jgi:hypothetical protein
MAEISIFVYLFLFFGGMIPGIVATIFINPQPFNLSQIYLSRIARVNYYEFIKTRAGKVVRYAYYRINDGKEFIAEGNGDYLKPKELPNGVKQEFIQGRKHIVVYDMDHSEAYSILNTTTGELEQRKKFTPIAFGAEFHPAWHRKMRESDSIKKTLQKARDKNQDIIIALIAGVVLLGALYIFFGQ